MKNIIIIFIVILTSLLVTLPTLAAEFSPLDDPVERYNFNFKEGKYKISLGHARKYQSLKQEDLEIDMDSMLNYNLTLEYNIQRGVKIKIIKNWMPEYSNTITPLLTRNAVQEDSISYNNWGLECTYKADPTAHVINFSYQSSITTQKSPRTFVEYDTRKDSSDRFTLSYKPDIALGGLGMEVGYETNEEMYHIQERNSDIYHLTISYEGQI